jgi:hypothetical protein
MSDFAADGSLNPGPECPVGADRSGVTLEAPRSDEPPNAGGAGFVEWARLPQLSQPDWFAYWGRALASIEPGPLGDSHDPVRILLAS